MGPTYGPMTQRLQQSRMPGRKPPMMDEDMIFPGEGEVHPEIAGGYPYDVRGQDMGPVQNPVEARLVHSRPEVEKMFSLPSGGQLPPGVNARTQQMERLAPQRSDPMMGKLYEHAHRGQHTAIGARLREQVGLEREHANTQLSDEAGREDTGALLDELRKLRAQRQSVPPGR